MDSKKAQQISRVNSELYFSEKFNNHSSTFGISLGFMEYFSIENFREDSKSALALI